jgi:hypothetical protein
MLQGTNQIGLTKCYEIADAATRKLIPERLNVTMHFTSENHAVVSDGTGRLYVVVTGDRSQASAWKDVYSGQPLGSDVFFTVLHSVEYLTEQICFIDIICLHIDKNPTAAADIHASSFVTTLKWLTLTSDKDNSFRLTRTRTLQSCSCPDYIALHPKGTSLIVASEKSVQFVYDSLKPIVVKHQNGLDGKSSDEEVPFAPDYTWSQTDFELTVMFELPPTITKTDILYSLLSNRLDVRLKSDDSPLIAGDLCDTVDTNNSTWTLVDNNVLEIHLFKIQPTKWTCVVAGDDRGKELIDQEKLTEINEQLAQYTSETLDTKPEGETLKSFNTQQLEECDAIPEEDTSIWCFDGESHEILHQVNISSHQWLFSAPSPAPDQSNIICLRHDVDGVVWQPCFDQATLATISWHHAATFNAFGYVQASKQQKKFVSCAPDFSYVFIADCVRHIYVYRQPTSISSPIRNRKTGETIGTVAKQQLVSLESTENILGVRGTRERIFVVSGKTLYVVVVKEQAAM